MTSPSIILGVIVFLIYLLSLGIASNNIVSKLYKNNKSFYLDSASKFLIGVIVTSVIYALLGFSGVLNKLNFFLVSFLILFSGLYKFNIGSIKEIFYRKLFDEYEISKLLLLISPVLLIGIFSSLLPTFDWDMISQYFTIPKLHIESGNTSYLTNVGFFSAFPAYGEALVGVPLLVSGDERFVQLYITSFYAFILYFSGCIFTQLSKSKFFLLLCLISVAYLPLLINHLGIAKVEIVQSVFLLASFYFLMLYKKNKLRNNIFYSFIFYSFSLGIKYTSIFALPFYCLFYYFFIKSPSNKFHIKNALVFFLIFLIINIIWLGYNYAYHCNPIFPILLDFFGSCSYPLVLMQEIVEMLNETTYHNIFLTLNSSNTIFSYLPFLFTAFGFINILILLFVLFGSHIKNEYFYSSFKILFILFFIFHIFIYFWEFRYFYIFLILFLIISFAYLSIYVKKRHIKFLLISLVFIQSISSLYFFTKTHHGALISHAFMTNISSDKFKQNFVNLYWVSEFINENTKLDEVIAFNFDVQPFYYLERKFFHIHEFNPEMSFYFIDSSSELFNALLNKNISYLVWRNAGVADERYKSNSKAVNFHIRLQKLKDDLVVTGSLVLVHQKDDVLIYKVNK